MSIRFLADVASAMLLFFSLLFGVKAPALTGGAPHGSYSWACNAGSGAVHSGLCQLLAAVVSVMLLGGFFATVWGEGPGIGRRRPPAVHGPGPARLVREG